MPQRKLGSIINDLIEDIPHISSERKYWFVRTNSGRYYKHFKDNALVAIGWNNISLEDIKKAENSEHYRDELYIRIVRNNPEEKRPGHVVNQVRDFVLGIKKGDVVIIPSESSDYYSFGVMENDEAYNALPSSNNKLEYSKRKNVEWILTDVPYSKLDPNLFKLKYLQKTITKIDSERTVEAIDRSTQSLFIKKKHAHLVLRIKKDDDVSAFDLGSSLTDLITMAEDIAKDNSLSLSKKDFSAKINVQSPGTVEIISLSVVGIALVCALIGMTIGVEYEAKFGFMKFNIKTQGLLQAIIQFRTDNKNRKRMDNLMDKLNGMQLDKEDAFKLLEQLIKNDNTTP
jgi:hypothetical protein